MGKVIGEMICLAQTVASSGKTRHLNHFPNDIHAKGVGHSSEKQG